MDNRDLNQPSPQDDKWLDKILGEAEQIEEITLDEQAVSSAGLHHPDELNLENILAEDWGTDPLEESQELEPSPVPVEEPEEEPIEDEAPEEIAPKRKMPQKKRRPKRKKGYGLLGIPQILATVVWLFLIVAIGVSLGRVIWVCCADVMAFGKANEQVTVTITDTDTIDTISEKLGKANLIRYPQLFRAFAQLTGKDESISVGTFTLNAQLDYNAMINAMGAHAPAREVVEILFPEGYTCAQMFALLEEKNVCSVAELEAYAADGELDDYWFLAGVPRGDKYCLEGYLAPDTYKFYTNDDPERVLEKFLDEFDDRFTDIMRKDLETLQENYRKLLASHGYGDDYVQEHPLTLHAVLTLASIVQKETANNSESYDIASVFFNRLTNPGDYPFLDSDATVIYAIGDYFGVTTELSANQLATDSPYNTRNHKGLPPGPICNPGVFSLYAALDPNETSYHYFVYDSSIYKHRFSKTYSEHLRTLEALGL